MSTVSQKISVCFAVMEEFIDAGINHHRLLDSGLSPIDMLLPAARDFDYANTFLNTIIAILVERGAYVSGEFAVDVLLIPQVRDALTFRNKKLTTKVILSAIINSVR